jgi:hypothetical protein
MIRLFLAIVISIAAMVGFYALCKWLFTAIVMDFGFTVGLIWLVIWIATFVAIGRWIDRRNAIIETE